MLLIVLMISFGDGPLFSSGGNNLGLIYFMCYVSLVFWVAFETPVVRLNFDLSYGIYIWHMPVINFLLVLAMPSASLAFSLTIMISGLSWFFVEKPALKLKRRTLRPVNGPDTA